jgi:hypothetical protein
MYLEGLRRSGSGTVLTAEITCKNKGNSVPTTPFSVLEPGATLGIWLPGGSDAATGGPSVNPVSAAITLGKNSAAWHKGIVFSSDCLTAENVAIAFANNHQLVWYSSASVKSASIRSTRVPSNGLQSFLDFTDNGITLSSRGDVLSAVFTSGGATDNSWPAFSSGVDNSYVTSASSAANSNLALLAKGSGRIRFFNDLQFSYSAFTTAATPANFTATRYITVYDNGGATLYIPARTAPW